MAKAIIQWRNHGKLFDLTWNMYRKCSTLSPSLGIIRFDALSYLMLMPMLMPRRVFDFIHTHTHTLANWMSSAIRLNCARSGKFISIECFLFIYGNRCELSSKTKMCARAFVCVDVRWLPQSFTSFSIYGENAENNVLLLSHSCI